MTDTGTYEPNPTRWPGVCWNHVAREIAREVEQRHRVFPERVMRGQMTQAEANHQIAVFEALTQDVARIIANRAHHPPAHHFTRKARIDALLRERDYRRRRFPKWVSAGQIAQDQATHRSHCIEILLNALDQGLDFDPNSDDIKALCRTYGLRWYSLEERQNLGPPYWSEQLECVASGIVALS